MNTRLEVALVAPKADADGGEPGLHEALKEIRGIAKNQNWGIQEYRTRTETTARHGTRAYLENAAAEKLYKQLHRSHVAVVSLQRPGAPGPAILRRPPIPGSLVGRDDVVSLRDLARHKGFFARVRWNGPATRWVRAFAGWANGVHNEGIRDPRALPLHSFNPTQVRSRALLTEPGRERFTDIYGSPAKRADDHGRFWEDGKAWHGHEELHLAGKSLPPGFHWDVQAYGQACRLETFVGVWLFSNYLNVSPDGQVRPPPRDRSVKRIAG